MKNNIITLKTSSNNHYIYSYNTSYFSLIPINFYNLINIKYGKTKNCIDEEYYRKKQQYLYNHNILSEEENFQFVSLTKKHVTDAINELKHIVFEVTDSCNLSCFYCSYGDLYCNNDERLNSMMTFDQALPIIKYVENLWKNGSSIYDTTRYISFYGGEPLLNMKFIKAIVTYFSENEKLKNINFMFSMTTNGILIDKYLDFLVENNFVLLISLDGNKDNNSYRTFHDGTSSFDKIISNIDLIRSKYPDYFKKNIQFNSVLHDKNSIEDIFDYIYNKYETVPHISGLNSNNIRSEKQECFSAIYNNYSKSLTSSRNSSFIEKKLFLRTNSYRDFSAFLQQNMIFYYNNYNNLLYDNKIKRRIPSATCIPFSRKLFMTINNKILACEKIGQGFVLGYVKDNDVVIDFEDIVERYNNIYDCLISTCRECYNQLFCNQCVFYLKRENQRVKCLKFFDLERFSTHLKSIITLVETDPSCYDMIINRVNFE